MTPLRSVRPEEFEAAWVKLGGIYPTESWFRDVHLVENKDRIRRIVRDITLYVPADGSHPVVDVGCFNGFLCFLFHLLGYTTAGIDAISDTAVPERKGVLERCGAPFHIGNFNEIDPFPTCPRGSFSAAILGEVFEHILNHPLGFLKHVRDLLVPDGILVLTTPNPLTLANAVRMLRGRSFVWGDTEFATMPKIDASHRIISFEGIHYREYPQVLLKHVVEQAGLEVLRADYIGSSTHAKQPVIARLIKATPFWPWLQSHRWFGSGTYLVARRVG